MFQYRNSFNGAWTTANLNRYPNEINDIDHQFQPQGENELFWPDPAYSDRIPISTEKYKDCNKNRTGPRTEPWGTPAPTEKLDEACLRRQHKSSTKGLHCTRHATNSIERSRIQIICVGLEFSIFSVTSHLTSSEVKSSDMADTGVKVDGGVNKRKWRREQRRSHRSQEQATGRVLGRFVVDWRTRT
ncbi:hypothetical protein J6590_042618 [Homalodisca vitripennis]|nr:hypothetical protein J6590_042618 [Homalodisca vitripennis]